MNCIGGTGATAIAKARRENPRIGAVSLGNGELGARNLSGVAVAGALAAAVGAQRPMVAGTAVGARLCAIHDRELHGMRRACGVLGASWGAAVGPVLASIVRDTA